MQLNLAMRIIIGYQHCAYHLICWNAKPKTSWSKSFGDVRHKGNGHGEEGTHKKKGKEKLGTTFVDGACQS